MQLFDLNHVQARSARLLGRRSSLFSTGNPDAALYRRLERCHCSQPSAQLAGMPDSHAAPKVQPPTTARYLLGAGLMIVGIVLPLVISLLRSRKATSRNRRLRDPSRV